MTVVGYTANDIDMWADLAARALRTAGVDRDDIIHVAYGYGCSPAGWACTTAESGWARR